MFDRWQIQGIAATPEDMDVLQSQIRGSDMTIAMLLTWNFMASKFNEQLDAIEKELDKKYCFDSVSDMIKHVKELEDANV